MLRNTAQTILVFAFNRATNQPVLGDAANITCAVSLDGAAPFAIADTNPNEVGDGYYRFTILASESNGSYTCDVLPESSTADVQVLTVNHDRILVTPGASSPSGQTPQGNTTIDAINNAMADAVTAQEAGNYRLALTKVESAWMRICALPDSEFETERLEWSRDGLRDLMKWLKERVNSTADDGNGSRGAIIRPVEITYKRG